MLPHGRNESRYRLEVLLREPLDHLGGEGTENGGVAVWAALRVHTAAAEGSKRAVHKCTDAIGVQEVRLEIPKQAFGRLRVVRGAAPPD